MFAKKTEEKDESLENTMDKKGDIFDTPRMRCLQLKTEFLRKARNFKFWGFNKSRQRVTALDTVARYCKQSMELAEWDTELRNDVFRDIKCFLLEDRVLPVPSSVRENLHSAMVEQAGRYTGLFGPGTFCLQKQVHFVKDELEKLREEALTEYESEEWSKLEEFNQHSYDLRTIRKKIYEGNWGVIDNDYVLVDYTEAYKKEVKNFLGKYKKILGKREIAIWKKKIKDTLKFAEGILGFSIDEDDYREKNVNEDAENTSKSSVTTPEKLSNDKVEDVVQEIFDATKTQELLVEDLPSVPEDGNAFDSMNSVDLEIEARLLQLKFFRQTWCAEPSPRTDQGVVAHVAECGKELKRNTTNDDQVEVSEPGVSAYSSQEDVHNFNCWYYDQIDTKQKPSKLHLPQFSPKHPQSRVPFSSQPSNLFAPKLSQSCDMDVNELNTRYKKSAKNGTSALWLMLSMSAMLVMFAVNSPHSPNSPECLTSLTPSNPSQPLPTLAPVQVSTTYRDTSTVRETLDSGQDWFYWRTWREREIQNQLIEWIKITKLVMVR